MSQKNTLTVKKSVEISLSSYATHKDITIDLWLEALHLTKYDKDAKSELKKINALELKNPSDPQ